MKPGGIYVRSDHQKQLYEIFVCTHNLQTRTIYTFCFYKYSLKERALNNQCKIFTPLLRPYTINPLWYNIPTNILKTNVMTWPPILSNLINKSSAQSLFPHSLKRAKISLYIFPISILPPPASRWSRCQRICMCRSHQSLQCCWVDPACAWKKH